MNRKTGIPLLKVVSPLLPETFSETCFAGISELASHFQKVDQFSKLVSHFSEARTVFRNGKSPVLRINRATTLFRNWNASSEKPTSDVVEHEKGRRRR
jgi:hypothetical protein